MKNRIYEYDCVRLIATLLVVLGHSTYYVIKTSYGGIDYSMLASGGVCLAYKLLQKITALIYLFHMPLFMALSGALFQIAMKNNKYTSIKLLAVDKAKRLLIPFLVVSTVYSFPLKCISGYYDDSKKIFADFVIGQLLDQGNNHLWYCLALFLIFIIAYVIEKILLLNRSFWHFVKIILLLALHGISYKFAVNLVSQVCTYLIWFYLGFYFEEYRAQINEKIMRGKSKVMVASIIAVMVTGGGIIFSTTAASRYLEWQGAELNCL